MRSKQFREDASGATFVLALETGDEVVAVLTDFANSRSIASGFFHGIGALRRATIAYWDWDSKAYQEIRIEAQVEVASMTGNFARQPDGEIKLHAHVVLGKADGSAHAGHLVEGIVRPTIEVVVVAFPVELHRVRDAQTGLNLLDL